MAGEDNKLVKTLTLAPAVGLAITMVVGSGRHLGRRRHCADHPGADCATYRWDRLLCLCGMGTHVVHDRGIQEPETGFPVDDRHQLRHRGGAVPADRYHHSTRASTR